MTLATYMHIDEPVNPELLFLKARSIIGIPAEHPFREGECKWSWENGWRVTSIPGGFDSALDVIYVKGGGRLMPDARDPEDDRDPEPPAQAIVRLDTTYAAQTPHGNCDQLHDHIVTEYDGEWHYRAAPYATNSGADKAQQFVRDIIGRILTAEV